MWNLTNKNELFYVGFSLSVVSGYTFSLRKVSLTHCILIELSCQINSYLFEYEFRFWGVAIVWPAIGWCLGDWLLILVHYMKYMRLQSNENGTDTKPLFTLPGSEHGSLPFFIFVSALGSYLIYFSIGGFLHVSLLIFDKSFNCKIQSSFPQSGIFMCGNVIKATNGNASLRNSSRQKWSATRSSRVVYRWVWWAF